MNARPEPLLGSLWQFTSDHPGGGWPSPGTTLYRLDRAFRWRREMEFTLLATNVDGESDMRLDRPTMQRLLDDGTMVEIQPDELPQYLNLPTRLPAFDETLKGGKTP